MASQQVWRGVGEDANGYRHNPKETELLVHLPKTIKYPNSADPPPAKTRPVNTCDKSHACSGWIIL